MANTSILSHPGKSLLSVLAASTHLFHLWRREKPLGAVCLLLVAAGVLSASASPVGSNSVFPLPLQSYNDSHLADVWSVLRHRVELQPLNLWASLLFLGALLHAFCTQRFRHWGHVLEERHRKQSEAAAGTGLAHSPISAGARVLHFLGEVEAVFGIWCIPLFVLLAVRLGWKPTVNYFSHEVSYVEPVFVVVIMAIASTRPILQLAERCLRCLARLGGGGPAAWWLSILTFGPILGSLITEPAAMTISGLSGWISSPAICSRTN